jgi:hypothetical protein
MPNKSGQLLPGGYAQVHLQVKVTGQRLQVPVNALLFRSEGLRVVVVDDQHKTHLQALTIGRDYGTTLEVLQGLKADDWIVINPGDSLEEGVTVNVKQAPANQNAAQGSQAPAQGSGSGVGAGASGRGSNAGDGAKQPQGAQNSDGKKQ